MANLFLQLWSLLFRGRRLKSTYGEFFEKVILVTGASSGIGRELSIQLYRQGARLILASRSMERLVELREELKSSDLHDSVPAVVALDLEEVEGLAEKCREIEGIWGKVDILINCAGVSVRGGSVDTQLAVHRRIMEVNYFGALELTRNLVGGMERRGSGLIVNISSLQGRIAIPQRAAYAASKHALQAFSDCLRAELEGSGVRVLVVSPGYVNTELSRNSLTAEGDKYKKVDPSTSGGYSAEYVADCILQSMLSQDKEVILAPLHHRLAVLLRALIPSLYFYIMSRRARGRV